MRQYDVRDDASMVSELLQSAAQQQQLNRRAVLLQDLLRRLTCAVHSVNDVDKPGVPVFLSVGEPLVPWSVDLVHGDVPINVPSPFQSSSDGHMHM